MSAAVLIKKGLIHQRKVLIIHFLNSGMRTDGQAIKAMTDGGDMILFPN